MKRLHNLKKHLKGVFTEKPDKSFVKVFWIALVLVLLLYSGKVAIINRYHALQSVAILDRNGISLSLSPNQKGEYSRYAAALPPRVAKLLVKKEDRFFYYHPGVNPVSIARATLASLSGEKGGGASTITMQLVKNVLGNESNRSLWHKLQEFFLALDLELFTSKKTILTMYSNTVYLGNNIQGLAYGSEAYFKKELPDLNDAEILSLLATLGSPSAKNPWTKANLKEREMLAGKLGVQLGSQEVNIISRDDYELPFNFELATLIRSYGVGSQAILSKDCSEPDFQESGIPVGSGGLTESSGLASSCRKATGLQPRDSESQPKCVDTCTTTLDAKLTEQLREIVKKHVERGWDAGAHTGALVVIKLPENELVAMIGSPDPGTNRSGSQINMAIQPRPIGSTIKPFIYLKGYEAGLRPYSLVDDREYKFPTADGFPLYPKNYDGQYRGIVTLHYALSNSLNVPSVKTLEYVGLLPFYNFLQQSLGFQPLNDLGSYQYGIALGGLEMDTLTLAHLFSIFPLQGVLKPLTLFTSGTQNKTIATPMSAALPERRVADPKYIQLVSQVLNDRTSGVEQFGLASSLNLSQHNYAVKTGTSRDFHDSWTMGYTPDFLVVAWLGNAENKPLKQVSGAEGAGAIWHDAMELLLNTPYNKQTPLPFNLTAPVSVGDTTDFGFPGENVAAHRNLLLANQSLITSPHQGDVFELEADTVIPLIASQVVSWYVDGELYASKTSELNFHPTEPKTYTIEAVTSSGKREKIRITLR